MKKKWFRLDNAALIFPAVLRHGWNNSFRVAVTLREPVDRTALNQAIADLKPRFPTFFVRLRTGFFWYYLEEIEGCVTAEEEYAWPLTPMTRRILRRRCIRVLTHGNRIAVEIFHSVTDGTGGMAFLQNLTARYLEIKTGEKIPPEGNLRDFREAPRGEETRDCFPLCAAARGLSRAEETAWRLRGTPEAGRFLHIITGTVSTERLLEEAHRRKVTVTAFLAAVLAESVAAMQAESGRIGRRARPVKITVPVNLRKTFGLFTLRNFTLAVNVGIDPGLGSYTLEEICTQIGHQLAYDACPQRMAGRVTKNVSLQRNPLIRLIPLPIKNGCMRLVYALSGERKGCLNISNMGEVRLPEAMAAYIQGIEFIIGVQLSYPNNCSVVSWNGKTCISMIRNIQESELERRFFSRLVALDIPVEIASNDRR